MNSIEPIEISAAGLIEAEPAFAAPLPVRELRLHPKVFLVWILGTLAFVALAAFVSLLVSLFSGNWIVAAIAVAIGTLIITSLYFYSRAYVARFRCRLLSDGLWVDRGVWWRSEIFVPRARVQHTDVQQGPIARRYGIASLKLFTAGASHGEIEIDGLIHADAVWLRDELLGRQGHDGV